MNRYNNKTTGYLTTLFLMFWLLPALASEPVMTPYNIFDLKNISEVAVSPDKRFIAYTVIVPRPFTDSPGSDYRELHIYDTATGKIIPRLTGRSRIFSLGWTPGGKVIIVILSNCTKYIKLWNTDF